MKRLLDIVLIQRDKMMKNKNLLSLLVIFFSLINCSFSDFIFQESPDLYRESGTRTLDENIMKKITSIATIHQSKQYNGTKTYTVSTRYNVGENTTYQINIYPDNHKENIIIELFSCMKYENYIKMIVSILAGKLGVTSEWIEKDYNQMQKAINSSYYVDLESLPHEKSDMFDEPTELHTPQKRF